MYTCKLNLNYKNNLVFGTPLPTSSFQEEKEVICSCIQKQSAFLCVLTQALIKKMFTKQNT